MNKYLVLAVLALTLSFQMAPVTADAEGIGWGKLYQDRLEIGRGMLEVQNVDWTTLLHYYTDDIEYHDSIVDVYGIDMLTQFLARLYGSSPDLVTTIEDETVVDDIYSATWTMIGSFNGVPYEANGMSIIKFRPRSRQVYYWRDYYSEGDIMANVPGFDQAILGFRTYYRCAVDPTFECPLDLATDDAPSATEPIFGSPTPDEGGRRDLAPFRLRQERLRVGRALVEINPTNWQSLLQYYTDDYEYHDPIVDIYGFDTLVPFFARLFSSSPDLITTVEDEMLSGDVYTATWTMIGQFNGVPYSAKGMSIVKFRDRTAKTYYSRDYYSEADVMATIPGLDQAVEAFRIAYRCVVDPAFDCPIPPPSSGLALERRVDRAPRSGSGFALRQNVPNPFNPVTSIYFDVPAGGADVKLRVYDVAGRLVRTLVDGPWPSGTSSVTWNGENDQGQRVASGTYYYKLETPSHTDVKAMVLLK